MSLSRKIVSIGLLVFLVYTSIVVMESCDRTTQQKHAAGEVALVKETFVGSSACQSCHAKEFADWRKSDHFLAMQEPHDSTVLGDFNNATLNADGITSKFFKRNGKFYINTQGDDGLNHDFEVIYTFGYFPLQQYLIAFPGGVFKVPGCLGIHGIKNGFINIQDKRFITKIGCIGQEAVRTGIQCVPHVTLPTFKKIMTTFQMRSTLHGMSSM